MSIVACLQVRGHYGPRFLPANWQQLASQRGNVNGNIERADEIIMNTKPENLDLLCLPEYVFCGKPAFLRSQESCS